MRIDTKAQRVPAAPRGGRPAGEWGGGWTGLRGSLCHHTPTPGWCAYVKSTCLLAYANVMRNSFLKGEDLHGDYPLVLFCQYTPGRVARKQNVINRTPAFRYKNENMKG